MTLLESIQLFIFAFISSLVILTVIGTGYYFLYLILEWLRKKRKPK